MLDVPISPLLNKLYSFLLECVVNYIFAYIKHLQNGRAGNSSCRARRTTIVLKS